MQTQKREVKATYYGIALLAVTLFVYIAALFHLTSEIISYLCFAALGAIRLGLIFYGQTVVKKLNRDYLLWAAFLFLFTSIALILLGQVDKIKKAISVIQLDTEAAPENPNKLPSLTVGTDSGLLLEAITNDSFTLKYMLNNYRDFIKENTNLFPVLAAYQLNKRNVVFEEELWKSLDRFATEKGHESFRRMLAHLKMLSPEEIAGKYQ